LRDFPKADVEARLLLLKSSSIGNEQFFSSPGQKLSRRQERNFFKLIARRLTEFPLAYLTETKEFWSIPFKVFLGVLIPRPETELIVEKVVEFSSRKEETIVDIGTGCGNIIISLAKELPQANFIATDISQKAIKVARLNASEQKINNIFFIRGNLFSPLRKLNLKGRCDFIVSNPPYVSEEDWTALPAEIKNHEPKKALVPGKTGLEIIKKIIQGCSFFLKPGGFLLLEIGEGKKEKVASFFNSGWEKIWFYNDLSGIPRVVAAKYSGYL